MSDLEPQPLTGSPLARDNDPVLEKVGICHTCAHRRGVWTCNAFTDRIPNEILGGDVAHTSPYPGDNGIIYKPLQQ